jgi:hypothetical protein
VRNDRRTVPSARLTLLERGCDRALRIDNGAFDGRPDAAVGIQRPQTLQRLASRRKILTAARRCGACLCSRCGASSSRRARHAEEHFAFVTLRLWVSLGGLRSGGFAVGALRPGVSLGGFAVGALRPGVSLGGFAIGRFARRASPLGRFALGRLTPARPRLVRRFALVGGRLCTAVDLPAPPVLVAPELRGVC